MKNPSTVLLQRRTFTCTSFPQTTNYRLHTFTTPIFYVNADAHLGHLYSGVLCDAMRRWHDIRYSSIKSSFMSTGTDEHGIKIQQAASANNRTARQHVDIVSAKFKNLFDSANVGYDRFFRTTDKDHREAVQTVWKKLLENGHVYKGKHEGWYSVSDECFYTDSQTDFTGDADGKTIRISKETGKEVSWVSEENYMFALSRFKEPLIRWLQENPSAIHPSPQHNQVMVWLKQEEMLPDISVSRPVSRQSWGIPVPDDPDHTIYVWIDALTNYLTITGFPHKWSFNDSRLKMAECGFPNRLHVIGKDILRFHAIYWPALLMAMELPLPDKILAHAHWTFSSAKMSKSLGNVVDPFDLMSKYGVDAVRYYVLRDGGVANDGDFSEDMLKMRYQVELADQLGNLLARCMGKAVNPNGIIPELENDAFNTCSNENMFIDKIDNMRDQVSGLFELGEFGKGLGLIMQNVHETNRYIQMHEPWKLMKTGQKENQMKAQVVVYNCLEALRVFGILLQPAMPETMDRMLDHLNVPKDERNFNDAIIDRRFQRRPGKIISRHIPFPKIATQP